MSSYLKTMTHQTPPDGTYATVGIETIGRGVWCDRNNALEDECSGTGIATNELIYRLDKASQNESLVGELRGFQLAPLTQIINYILEKHHVFTRQELDCLDALLDKVCIVHGANHPKLIDIRSIFKSLDEELRVQMRREERVLFPYLIEMEDAIKHAKICPRPPFGTVRNLVRLIEVEHARASKLLCEIRRASLNYTVPPDGCLSYRILFQALKDFEQDLRQHTFLEDTILFPRSVKMETL